MGRKHRNARKNRGARACASKNPPKVQPPAPPSPETVEFPELPFDVIPLVLRAIFDGWDDRDPEATCRTAARWSTLNQTHHEACAAEQVWDDLIVHWFPRHTPAVIAERGLLSCDKEFNDWGEPSKGWWTMPDPATFDTARDYYNALCGECIELARDRRRLKELYFKALEWYDWHRDPPPPTCGCCSEWKTTQLEWKWEQTEEVYRDFVETQHEVYVRMAIVRGLDVFGGVLFIDRYGLSDVTEKILKRIWKNMRTVGKDWDLDFPDLEALRGELYPCG